VLPSYASDDISCPAKEKPDKRLKPRCVMNGNTIGWVILLPETNPEKSQGDKKDNKDATKK
jgi:hypothetical protein